MASCDWLNSKRGLGRHEDADPSERRNADLTGLITYSCGMGVETPAVDQIFEFCNCRWSFHVRGITNGAEVINTDVKIAWG